MAKSTDSVPEFGYSSRVRKSLLVDAQGNSVNTLFNPAHARAVVPSDSTEFAEASVLRVDGSGTLVLTHWGDTDSEVVTVETFNDGEIYPFPVKKVWAATGASNITRYY